VSNDPRGDSVSPGQQEKENRAWCAAKNIEVLWSITDSGFSASRFSTKERPGYKQVARNLAGEAPVDVLVAWEASRYARDLGDYVALCDICYDPRAGRNTLLAYKGNMHDLSQPGGRFSTGVDALLAERESAEIRERVLRSVRARVTEGRAHGRIAYGYRSVHDPYTGRPLGREPDPDIAPIVVEMCRRVLDGEALHALTRELIARGVPSPGEVRAARRGADDKPARPWVRHELRRMVLNPAYAALRMHKGEEAGPADWAPLISEQEHREIVALVRNPSRINNRDWRPRYLLAGIIRCGVCGAPCRRVMNRASASYACDGYQGGNRCVSRLQKPIDQLVTDTVLGRMEDPVFREAFTVPVVRTDDEPDPFVELKALEDRLRAFDDAAEAGELSAAAFGRMEARLVPQIEAARARTVTVRIPAPVRDLMEADDPRELWHSDRFSIVRKRAAIRYLVDVLEILPLLGQRGVHGFDPSRIDIQLRGVPH
jgi:DNA invertase Pin-like site-specific DNA recombinase